jgi:hypothetical protein
MSLVCAPIRCLSKPIDHRRPFSLSPAPSPLMSSPCTKPCQHRRKFLGTDIEVFAYPPPQHGCRYVPAAPLLLGLVQNVQDDTFLASQSVTNVGDSVILAISVIVRHANTSQHPNSAYQGRFRELGELIVRVTLRSAPFRKTRISTLWPTRSSPSPLRSCAALSTGTPFMETATSPTLMPA